MEDALRSLGVEAGDRFALLCRNDPRQAELIHAGYWMGAVPVPMFRGGWFFTGDIGHLDEEAFLYLLDRKKDMIITGGVNVWSGEVESALYRHQDVMEAVYRRLQDATPVPFRGPSTQERAGEAPKPTWPHPATPSARNE